MWIWNVRLEIEWSYNKGEWETNDFVVSAPNSNKAEDKARKICEKHNKAWTEIGEDSITSFHRVTQTRLVSIVRDIEIDA